jgi:hypothetical protein
VGERALLAGFVAAFIGLALGNTIGEVWMNDFQWVLFGLLVAVTSQPVLVLGSVRLRKRDAEDDQPRKPSQQAHVTA